VIAVTQGTIATNPQDLIIPTLEDLKDMDVLVVATIVISDEIASYTPPANARITKFIPSDQLLPHTDVIVSNGRYGGVQQAFAAVIPMVLAGQSEDKLGTTSRAAWRGAAINLAVHRPDPCIVREAVEKVMALEKYKMMAVKLKEAYGQLDSLGGDCGVCG
jgi:UDP:flavonoid glycosyltransferase YjiC (YdhE family)